MGSGGRTAYADANFGAMYETAGPFATDQTDGLWGIAYQSLGKMPTLIDAFVAAGQPNIFSMCLSAFALDRSDANSNGEFSPPPCCR